MNKPSAKQLEKLISKHPGILAGRAAARELLAATFPEGSRDRDHQFAIAQSYRGQIREGGNCHSSQTAAPPPSRGVRWIPGVTVREANSEQGGERARRP